LLARSGLFAKIDKFNKTNLLWIMMSADRPIEEELIKLLAEELQRDEPSLRFMW
jgi:hypothetical protein